MNTTKWDGTCECCGGTNLYNVINDVYECEDCIYCVAWDDGFGIEYQCKRTGDWCIEDNDPCYHFRKCKNE